MMKILLFVVALLIPSLAFADEPQPVDPVQSAVPVQECVPPPGGRCITKEQLSDIKSALQELDDIHQSPAVLTTDDKITIIQDWKGRVYTNGGQANPIRFKLKIGKTLEREMGMTLQTQVHYRPEPPDPMFRLRVRAQVGLFFPQAIKTLDEKQKRIFDAGIGWDFFHIGDLNAALYTGVNSCGGGLGYDLTKNFGPYVGYSLIYDGFESSLLTSVYFSFN